MTAMLIQQNPRSSAAARSASSDASAPSPSAPRPTAPSSALVSPFLFPFQRLDAYAVARTLAARVHRASIADAELRDQATRAAKSAFLNLCEGLPDDRPAMRRKYFASADGSLHEVAGAIDLASAIGALGDAEAAEILALAFRLRGILRGLLGRASARGA
jgi:four helix bundle protein